jgi:drug/metabolite transporter (DMT)-like permease
VYLVASHGSSLRGPVFALGAAVTFSLSVPLGKLLLGNIGSFTLAGTLYLGAGVGLSIYRAISRDPRKAHTPEAGGQAVDSRSRRSVLALVGAIASGGVIAPALLFWGLATLAASSVSLLLSLEVVFTALLAGLLFREQVAKRVWAAVVLMLAASVLLSWTGDRLSWSLSALAVVGATLFWGLDNNLTREVRGYSAAFIAQIKGLTAGSVNLVIGVAVLGQVPHVWSALAGAALGAVSYGLSLMLFVYALRLLGSARTGAYFSSAPVLAAVISLAVFVEQPGWRLLVAFALVVVASVLMVSERHVHQHIHGTMVHSHAHWPDEEHRHTH